MIDDVVRNANCLGDSAGVVDVVERAASASHRLGHVLAPCEPALVPELHGEADDVVAVGAQHGRNGRRINSSRHGHGDGVVVRHLAIGT